MGHDKLLDDIDFVFLWYNKTHYLICFATQKINLISQSCIIGLIIYKA